MTENVTVALYFIEKEKSYNHGKNGVANIASGTRYEDTNRRHNAVIVMKMNGEV